MNRERKFLWILVGLFLMVGLNGCASSEAEPECEDDFGCAFGERCNIEQGVCEEEIREGNNNNNTPDSGLPDDTGTPDDTGGQDDTGTPDDTGDQQDTGDDQDTDPLSCVPACGNGEVCQNGTCVPDGGGGTCAQKGDSCDPSVVDQGSFWCAGDGNGGGECMPKCSEAFSANGCAVGEYCWDIGSATQPAPACIASQCQTDGDCTNGSCLNFDNSFGICLASGSTPEGQSCDPSVANTCAEGLICRQEPSGSGQGVCRTLCDPWTSTSGCPTGQMCDLYTTREGVCRTETEAMPTAPFQQCTASGNMCDDGVICLGFSSGDFCVPYCRTGMGDCAGTGGGTQVVCNNYVVAGERTWGLCLPACASAADCGTGSQCQGGVCRSTCTPGNEVQDCCGGDSVNCNWTCVNGLCE